MTDGIGRIFGGNSNSYGVSGYVPKKEQEQPEEPQQASVQPELKNVNPDAVLNYMAAANSSTVQPAQTVTPRDLPEEVVNRVAASIAQFQQTYDVALEEFGNPDVALGVVDLMTNLK